MPPSTGGGGGACAGSGSGLRSRPSSRSWTQRTGFRLSGVGSSQRSRNTVSTSCTAGPVIAAWMSCHGGVAPYSSAISSACGSPWWSASSRREWHRSMPPTYAMSRDGSSRCRITTNFWWCEPPVRTRMSSSASAPRSCSSWPSRRFSPAVKPSFSQCERQTRPRTSTPRSSARPSTSATSLPGSPGQPLVGVALPVGEEHQVARPGGLEALEQLGEVRRAVDQRPDQVALRPGLAARVRVVEPGAWVPALRPGEQPVGGFGLGGHAPYAR